MNDTTAPNAVPLYRPINGRYLTGTALGIAQKLDLPPWVIRTAFAALIFTGVGIPLYAISWLLIPGEGENEAIGERLLRDLSGSRAWVGVALVVVAGAILASSLPFFDGGVIIPTALLVLGVILFRGNYNNRPAGPPTPQPINPMTGELRPLTPPAPRTPPRPPSMLGRLTVGFTVLSLGILAIIDRASPLVDARPRHYLALAVTIVGLGILVGTFYGRARWLIPFGLLLVPASVGAGFTEFSDEARVQIIRPANAAELNSLYELPVGELTIDLRDLEFDEEPVEVAVEMGVGSINLLLPAEVGLQATTEVGIGAAHIDGDGRGGFGVEFDRQLEGDQGLLIVDLEVGIGEITVTTGRRPGLDRIPPLPGDLLDLPRS